MNAEQALIEWMKTARFDDVYGREDIFDAFYDGWYAAKKEFDNENN